LDSGEKKDLDLSDSGGKEEAGPSGMKEYSRGSVVVVLDQALPTGSLVAALDYPMGSVVATLA